MDRDKLIGELAIKHQILLDKTDPIFALVALNELVLSEMVDKANELSSNMEVNLSPVLEKLNLTLGLIKEKSEFSNGQLVNTIQLLRSETIAIIRDAKAAAEKSAGETAAIQGSHAINGIGEAATKAKMSIETFTNELKNGVAGTTQGLVETALKTPIANLVSKMETAVGALDGATIKLGNAKTDLENAKKALKITLWEGAGCISLAAFFGAAMALLIVWAAGTFEGKETKEIKTKVEQIITGQRVIFDKINEQTVKTPAKNPISK